jgi:hypothetical protein
LPEVEEPLVVPDTDLLLDPNPSFDLTLPEFELEMTPEFPLLVLVDPVVT